MYTFYIENLFRQINIYQKIITAIEVHLNISVTIAYYLLLLKLSLIKITGDFKQLFSSYQWAEIVGSALKTILTSIFIFKWDHCLMLGQPWNGGSTSVSSMTLTKIQAITETLLQISKRDLVHLYENQVL